MPPRRSPARSELRALWRLAAPLSAIQVGNFLTGVVSTAIVGRLSAAAQSGAGLGNTLFFAVSVVGTGILLGFDPLLAQALGAGDPLRARRLFWQAIAVAAALAAALTLPIVLAGLLLPSLGIGPEIARHARPFLYARAAGLLPLLLFAAARSYLQAIGRTRPLVLAMALANLFNAGATILFVFGGSTLGPWAGPLARLPGLGALGAALATSLCHVLELGIAALAVRAIHLDGFAPAQRRPSAADLRLSLRVGLPIGLQLAAEVGIFALVALLAGNMGAEALAAHYVALNLAGLSFSATLGVGAAASVRVGRAVGAGDAPSARRAGLLAFATGGVFMAGPALAFLLAPSSLARLLTSEPSVLATAVPLLGVAALFQLSDGLQSVGSGALRGAGDTRFAFLSNLVGHYLVGLPVAAALGIWAGRGVTGLWWGLCAGLSAVAATLVLRFLALSSKQIAPLQKAEGHLLEPPSVPTS